MKPRRLLFILIAIFFPIYCLAQSGDTVLLKEGLALKLQKGYAAVIVAPNPIEADLVLDKWKSPTIGTSVKFQNGQQNEWYSITADKNGWFSDTIALHGGYVYFPVDMNKKTIMILQAMGNEMAYINGTPRSGNPYGLNDVLEEWDNGFLYSLLPIELEKGRNDLLFRCSRERLKVRLYKPSKPVEFNSKDLTTPDLLTGEKIDTWGSIVITNASLDLLNNLFVQASIGENDCDLIPVPIIQPLSVRKVGFKLNSVALNISGEISVSLSLFRKINNKIELVDKVNISLRVINGGETRKETFISKIDGSVQYYAVNPTLQPDKPNALFLSLHGAGVEALGQARAYSRKSWGYVVAPTNRRPYGFNWEDWGRIDALETMDIIKKKYNIDENRIYLTGHSMGGHGTYHVGSLFSDQFAVIGPSAGWLSFWSYRYQGQNVIDTSEVRKIIRRSTSPSETFMHITNYKQLGVYIIHGSEDDNVFPTESRTMVKELSKFHKDFIYHEEKGVNHWWDHSEEPGADCLDWSPMFDFFARHARPGKSRIRNLDFVTTNPGISSKNNWLTIDAQVEQLKLSSVIIRFDPGLRTFSGKTNNVSRLAFDLDILPADKIVNIDLNNQKINNIPLKPDQKQLWLDLKDGNFVVSEKPDYKFKGSNRYGTFKEAFRNKMILVYGTKGSSEENKWAFEKARYDAEKYWYQGNSSIDVISDIDFNPSAEPERNVIIYGNINTNAAWKKLLFDCPVIVKDGIIQFGDQKIKGKNLSCLFVWPKSGTVSSSIGVISGTGITGMKINNRLPYVNPGINLPDCTILSSDVLTKGDEGVILTGFFGLDWSIGKGEFVRSK